MGMKPDREEELAADKRQDDKRQDDEQKRRKKRQQEAQEEPPIAEAMRWVSAITTAAGMMALPPIASHWLEQKWPWTSPWLTLVALAFGVSSGLYYILALSKREDEKRKNKTRPPEP
jgi:F0F1-type ATP synthase assembly protein I